MGKKMKVIPKKKQRGELLYTSGLANDALIGNAYKKPAAPNDVAEAFNITEKLSAAEEEASESAASLETEKAAADDSVSESAAQAQTEQKAAAKIEENAIEQQEFDEMFEEYTSMYDSERRLNRQKLNDVGGLKMGKEKEEEAKRQEQNQFTGQDNFQQSWIDFRKSYPEINNTEINDIIKSLYHLGMLLNQLKSPTKNLYDIYTNDLIISQSERSGEINANEAKDLKNFYNKDSLGRINAANKIAEAIDNNISSLDTLMITASNASKEAVRNFLPQIFFGVKGPKNDQKPYKGLLKFKIFKPTLYTRIKAFLGRLTLLSKLFKESVDKVNNYNEINRSVTTIINKLEKHKRKQSIINKLEKHKRKQLKKPKRVLAERKKSLQGPLDTIEESESEDSITEEKPKQYLSQDLQRESQNIVVENNLQGRGNQAGDVSFKVPPNICTKQGTKQQNSHNQKPHICR